MTYKIETIDKFEKFREVLNDQPDRYIPVEEMKREFAAKIDPNGKVDPVKVKNMFENTLVYSLGLSEKGLDRETPMTTSFLAEVAMIWQTQLITSFRAEKDIKERTEAFEGYMITPVGVRVYNDLRNSRYSKQVVGLLTKMNTSTMMLLGATLLLLGFAVFPLIQHIL